MSCKMQNSEPRAGEIILHARNSIDTTSQRDVAAAARRRHTHDLLHAEQPAAHC